MGTIIRDYIGTIPPFPTKNQTACLGLWYWGDGDPQTPCTKHLYKTRKSEQLPPK